MSEVTSQRRARHHEPEVAAPLPPLRWWGWGDRDGEIPEGLAAILVDELGIDGRVLHHPVAQEDVLIDASRFPEAAHAELSDALGGHVNVDRRHRIAHAAGKSYVDLLRQRAGRPIAAPDAVVSPGSEADVAAVLAICERHDVAVVAFGGGTSVVGGVTPLRGSHAAVIALDLRRLDGLLDIDPVAHIGRLHAGTLAPAAEAILNRRGFTMGHFPQSFEYASLGGFAAARSAGQASGGYGRFDEIVTGLRCVTPRGTVVVTSLPPNAAGPSVRQMILGSEGALGIITEVSVRLHRVPTTQWYEGWSFSEFDTAAAALRRMAQARCLPDVARLSDADETRLTLAMAGNAADVMKKLLRIRGHANPCLAVVGWDGEPAAISGRRDAARTILREHGAVRLGRRVGESWKAHRFDAPYLRDPLIDRGVLVETLETVTTWGRVHALRAAVVATLRDALTVDGHEPLVGAHISHSYHDGGSLYFTVMARRDGDAVEQWLTAKRRVNDVLSEHGAAVTHHHGVGTDHAAWLEAQIGTEGMAALRALKATYDPAGIMNPGKLIPA